MLIRSVFIWLFDCFLFEEALKARIIILDNTRLHFPWVLPTLTFCSDIGAFWLNSVRKHGSASTFYSPAAHLVVRSESNTGGRNTGLFSNPWPGFSRHQGRHGAGLMCTATCLAHTFTLWGEQPALCVPQRHTSRLVWDKEVVSAPKHLVCLWSTSSWETPCSSYLTGKAAPPNCTKTCLGKCRSEKPHKHDHWHCQSHPIS